MILRIFYRLARVDTDSAQYTGTGDTVVDTADAAATPLGSAALPELSASSSPTVTGLSPATLLESFDDIFEGIMHMGGDQ